MKMDEIKMLTAEHAAKQKELRDIERELFSGENLKELESRVYKLVKQFERLSDQKLNGCDLLFDHNGIPNKSFAMELEVDVYGDLITAKFTDAFDGMHIYSTFFYSDKEKFELQLKTLTERANADEAKRAEKVKIWKEKNEKKEREMLAELKAKYGE